MAFLLPPEEIVYYHYQLQQDRAHDAQRGCPKREIWPFLKGSHISETRGVMPTKIGVHALDINPYLHEFFEPIPID